MNQTRNLYVMPAKRFFSGGKGGLRSVLPTTSGKFPAHIIVWSLAFSPAIGYLWYTSKHDMTDDQLEKELLKSPQYASQIRDSQARRKDMMNVIRKATVLNDKENDAKFNEMLSAGKSDATTKRVSYLDEEKTVYGDDEGVRKSQELQRSIEKEQKLKREAGKKRRKERQKIEKAERRAAGNDSSKEKKKKKKKIDESNASTTTILDQSTVVKTVAVTTLGVAIAAVAITFIGGNSSSRH
eukprot:CAMPEP_0194419240 /NCGR_PEP_ID=MMETSP0176-20130528/18461_1 /TAXON_ID=216777 /ORGANISM="Proboscia alata, Strain PI-D3" /LENGTH=239 /DNA_ID=CAMNT_0039226159 /DNA_START=66 /DNA_END=785 /DNA_ORIENTATION=+